MKYLLLTILLFSSALSALTLQEAQEAAKNNAPIAQMPAIIEQSHDLSSRTARMPLLPQITVSGKLTTQSEAFIPAMDKEQYQVVGEVSQTLWDGGVSRSKRRTLSAEEEASLSQNRVDMLSVKSSVNRFYFGALLCDEQLKMNELRRQELTRRLEQTTASVQSGVLEESDRAAVQVELVKVAQISIDLTAQRSAYIASLALLTGLALQDTTALVLPSEVQAPAEPSRPELLVYQARQNQYDAQKKEIDARIAPAFSLFFQGGYGFPGYSLQSMQQNDATGFWVTGLRMRWDLGSAVYSRSKLQANLEEQSKSVALQREAFQQSNAIQIAQKKSDIARLDAMIASDEEMVTLRSTIRTAAEAKVNYGSLTMTDFLSRCDEEESAKALLAQHRVQKIQAQWDLNLLMGEL